MGEPPFRIGAPTFERVGEPLPAEPGDPGSGALNPPEFDQGEWIRVSYPLAGFSQPTLWFEVDARYESWISDSCDAAVVVLIMLAMRGKGDIQVEGHLSPRFWWNLHNTIIPVLCQQQPEHGAIRVHASSFTDGAKPRDRAIVTGLSCGVDSFSVVADHLLAPDIRQEDTLTHLLFNHIGSHGVTPQEEEERAAIRWRQVRAAAEDLNMPLIRVRSNQTPFFGYWPDILIRYDHSLSLRNGSVPLLLQKGIKRWILASGMKWSEVSGGEAIHQPVADPILLPALATEMVEMVSVGCSYSRVEKTAQLADLEVVRKHLDVCIRPADGLDNCSNCYKCARTLLTLDLLGKLDGFESTFDLALYRKNRGWHITETLADKEDFYKAEILQLMEEVGYKPPLSIRAKAQALRGFKALPQRWQEIGYGVRRRWRRITGSRA